jgi:hypothetical protein
MNKLATDAIKEINILLKIFNSLSPQFSFFLNLALLDSPDKTVKIL